MMKTQTRFSLRVFSAVMAASVPVLAQATVIRAPAEATHGQLRPQVLESAAYSLRLPAGSLLGKMDRRLQRIAAATPTFDIATAPQQLRALTPTAKFKETAPYALPLVKIDAVADGDMATLQSALESLGLQTTATFGNAIAGWLPVSQLEAAAALPALRQAKATRRPITRAGAQLSQGDYVQSSAAVRALGSGFDGSGVMVGVLSDSFNCYDYYQRNGFATSGYQGFASNGYNVNAAMDVSTGDLTGSVNVLSEQDCNGYDRTYQLPYSDEGRAILQLVHDVAPGAALAFYAAPDSETEFANGIIKLAQAGAKVIDDDIGYADEPFFQDGPIAQAIDQVTAQGVAYYSSAGNNGRSTYENTAPAFPVAAAAGTANAGEMLLNFDTSGGTTTTLPLTIPPLPPGAFIYFTLEWDQPFVTGAAGSPGSANALDLCVTDSSGAIQDCSGANAIGGDPVVYEVFGNAANSGAYTAQTDVGLVVGLVKGTAPQRIKLAVEGNGAGVTINKFNSNGPTIQGHAGAAGAATVGAVFYYETPACQQSLALESYSSAGGTPLLFDKSGTRLASPIVRNKPDFVDADGVVNTFLGEVYSVGQVSVAQCQGSTSVPSFFGTSAAAPHAAGAAALFLQAKPSLTPDQIRNAFSATASPLPYSGTGYNYDAGAGFVRVDAAYRQLGLTPPASTGGGGTTSGSTTGSTTGSPGTPVTGSSQPPASSGGGGGGSAGLIELTALAALALRRRRRTVV